MENPLKRVLFLPNGWDKMIFITSIYKGVKYIIK